MVVEGVTVITTRTLQAQGPPPLETKSRATLSYHTPKAYVKASRRAAGGMAYRPTSRATEPSRTAWFPQRIRTPGKTKVGPSIGYNLGNLHVMKNTLGRHPGPLDKIQRAPQGTLTHTQS